MTEFGYEVRQSTTYIGRESLRMGVVVHVNKLSENDSCLMKCSPAEKNAVGMICFADGREEFWLFCLS